MVRWRVEGLEEVVVSSTVAFVVEVVVLRAQSNGEDLSSLPWSRVH